MFASARFLAEISASWCAAAVGSELVVSLEAPAAGRVGDSGREVDLIVRWRNGWCDDRSHDGAWIVLRDRAQRAWPIVALEAGRSLEGAPQAAEVVVSVDGVGAFVRPLPAAGAHGRFATVELRVALRLALPRPATLSADALEMVSIPADSYELGDPDPRARALGSFHAINEDEAAPTHYEVRDESPIEVARAPGALWYEVGKVPEYRGDQRGPIPAEFPKGTVGCWVMKREFTQGQWAAFLSALPPEWLERRRFVPQLGDEAAACFSVAKSDGSFHAAAPERPLHFVTWDDSCALLDWWGLRPMTEFEFEKAARGPEAPVALDFPWGTADADSVARRVERSRDLSHATVEAEAVVDAETRIAVGASYYGVLDLAGSIWERIVSAGHVRGRAYRGTHGDGALDANTGDATNDDWPRGDAGGRAADGIGYRGGAEYFAPQADLTNPFSIVAGRTYAAWNGSFRSATYGARGVRSADQR